MTFESDIEDNKQKIINKFSLMIESIDEYYKNENINKQYERDLHKIISFFYNKNSSIILLTLRLVGFSSQWELWSHFSLCSKGRIFESLNQLEKYGLISLVNQKDRNFNKIKTYWKKQYPNSGYFPKMYKINPIFNKIIDIYSDEIKTRYLWKSIINKIELRRQSYDAYAKRNYRETDNYNTKCINCNSIIPENSIENMDYYKFKSGNVCIVCKRTATKEMILKWIK